MQLSSFYRGWFGQNFENTNMLFQKISLEKYYCHSVNEKLQTTINFYVMEQELKMSGVWVGSVS